jgi:hypothetical protein
VCPPVLPVGVVVTSGVVYFAAIAACLLVPVFRDVSCHGLLRGFAVPTQRACIFIACIVVTFTACDRGLCLSEH